MADQYRIERYRQAVWRNVLDRSGAPAPLSGRRYVGRVFNAGSIPTTVPAWFATHPVIEDGAEVEGGSPSSHVDTIATAFVLVLGPGVPVAGNDVIAKDVGGRWAADFGMGSHSRCPHITVRVFDCGGVPQPGATVHVTKSGGYDQTCTTDSTGTCTVPITVDGTYHIVATYGSNSASADLDTTHYCYYGFCLGGLGKVKGSVAGCYGLNIGPGVPVKVIQLGTTVATVNTDSLGHIEVCVPTADPVTLTVDSPPARYLGASVGPLPISPPCSTRTFPTIQLPTAPGYCCLPCPGNTDPGQLRPCASSPVTPPGAGSIDVTDPFFGITVTMLPLCIIGGAFWLGTGSGTWNCPAGYTHGACPTLTVDLVYTIGQFITFRDGSYCTLGVTATFPPWDHVAYPGCPAPQSMDGTGTWVPTTVGNFGIIHVTACPPGFSGTSSFRHPADVCPESSTFGMALTFPLTEV